RGEAMGVYAGRRVARGRLRNAARGRGATGSGGRGVPVGGDGRRNARRHRLLPDTERRPRGLPRRDHRRLPRLLVHGGRRRGRRRHRDRRGPCRAHLGRARLRAGAQPCHRRGADGGGRVHGLRRGALRGARVPSQRPAPWTVAAGLQAADGARRARAHVPDRGVPRSRRPLRGEGGGRRALAPVDPRHRERHPRRGGRADRLAALHAGARAPRSRAREPMLTLPSFGLVRARSLPEAIEALSDGRALPIASGTDVVPNMKRGLLEPARLVSVRRIPELTGVRVEEDGSLVLGAATTLAEIAGDARVARTWPGVAQAVRAVASPQIRNAGTLGGNVCLDTRCAYYDQSKFWRSALGHCLKTCGEVCHVVPHGHRCVAAFSADTPPALIASGARVRLASPAGERTTGPFAFYTSGGAHHPLPP